MGINAGSYVYSANRPNCNSWEIWFRTAISLKFDSFQTVLNKIMEYSENVALMNGSRVRDGEGRFITFYFIIFYTIS